MAYIEGFILAVPQQNKEAYRKHAADAVPFFKECGAIRMVETWADDVPDGKVTDFRRAVKAKPTRRCCSPGSSIPTARRATPR
jgi:uncharacterized protein YbaA (DUF1428 family)